MTNQATHDMFGWNKAELRGKNVNIIIPPPLAEHHSAYVRNYIQSGEWQSQVQEHSSSEATYN